LVRDIAELSGSELEARGGRAAQEAPHPHILTNWDYWNRCLRLTLLAGRHLPRVSRACPSTVRVLERFFVRAEVCDAEIDETEAGFTWHAPRQTHVNLGYLARELSCTVEEVKASLSHLVRLRFFFTTTSHQLVFDICHVREAARRALEELRPALEREEAAHRIYGCDVPQCAHQQVAQAQHDQHRGSCPEHGRAAVLRPVGLKAPRALLLRRDALEEMGEHVRIMEQAVRLWGPSLRFTIEIAFKGPERPPKPHETVCALPRLTRAERMERMLLNKAAEAERLALAQNPEPPRPEERQFSREDTEAELQALVAEAKRTHAELEALVESYRLRRAREQEQREEAVKKPRVVKEDAPECSPWWWVGARKLWVHLEDLTEADLQAMTKEEYAGYMAWYNRHPELHTEEA
jgi:hypothetical protein